MGKKHYNCGKDNPNYGKIASKETREKARQAKLGSKNPNYGKRVFGKDNPKWIEDDLMITYGRLHRWLRNKIPKPEKCEVCNIRPALDLANVTGVYNRDFSNWQYQCRRCHMLIDGRLYQFKKKRSYGVSF